MAAPHRGGPPHHGSPPGDDAPAENGRWGRIPAWWLGHPAIEADGLAVLAALSTYANARGECWPSQATLAAALKRSRSTINRILGQLAEAGVIEVQPRRSASGGRLSCLYRLRLSPAKIPATIPAAIPAEATASRPQRDCASSPPVSAPDIPVAPADSPCAPVRQKQTGFKQNPDSLAPRVADAAIDVPADWMPDADDLAWAQARFSGIDLGRHVEGFLLRCRAHGYRYRDISAAWRAWLVQDAAAGKAPQARHPAGLRVQNGPAEPTALAAAASAPTRSSPHPATAAAEQRLGAWMAAAARLNAAPPQPWR